ARPTHLTPPAPGGSGRRVRTKNPDGSPRLDIKDRAARRRTRYRSACAPSAAHVCKDNVRCPGRTAFHSIVACNGRRSFEGFGSCKGVERGRTTIEAKLRAAGRLLRVTISIGGTGKPSMKLRGTSFWPDVEVRDGQTALIAVEIKLVRKRASKALAEALGQALIYSCHYPKVFALVVHLGAY